MKVLMLSQFFAPTLGGEERVVEDLSLELRSRGHEVAVATLHHEGLPRREERDGITIYRLSSSVRRVPWLFSEDSRRHAPPFPDPETVRDLHRILAIERPEIVHAHNWMVYSYLPLARSGDRPLVMSLHDHSRVCAKKRLFRNGEPCSGPGLLKCAVCATGHYGLVKGVPTAAANGVMASLGRAVVDMYLPVSTAVADNARFGPHDRYRVVPNFVPSRLGHDAPAVEIPEVVPQRDFVAFVGDATEDKGIKVLLQAHRQACGDRALVVAGRPYLKRELHAAPNVLVLGPQNPRVVAEIVRRSAVVVVPSIWSEPFGLAALEASVVGTPVIASEIGGLPEVVSHNESGLLVPPGDVRALAAALERIFAESGLRDALAEGARRRARAFSADVVVPQVEAAYEDVLNTRRLTSGSEAVAMTPRSIRRRLRRPDGSLASHVSRPEE